MICIQYIFPALFILLLSGCKPSGCEACGPTETCIYGECYPSKGIVCGAHRHEHGGICACDSGWGGPKCSIPVGALIGAYHVTGVSTQWLVGNLPSSQSIDDTIMVSYQNDTFIAYNCKHTYTGGDTSNYTFMWTMGAQPYSKLRFRKSLNDSVFYESRTGGSGGGVTKYLTGVKLQ